MEHFHLTDLKIRTKRARNNNLQSSLLSRIKALVLWPKDSSLNERNCPNETNDGNHRLAARFILFFAFHYVSFSVLFWKRITMSRVTKQSFKLKSFVEI